MNSQETGNNSDRKKDKRATDKVTSECPGISSITCTIVTIKADATASRFSKSL